MEMRGHLTTASTQSAQSLEGPICTLPVKRSGSPIRTLSTWQPPSGADALSGCALISVGDLAVFDDLSVI